VAAFILIWMNLAVGIIGSEDNPANLMYGGVLAVAIVGAFMVRFRPMAPFSLAVPESHAGGNAN
jgi:hypothetical protein